MKEPTLNNKMRQLRGVVIKQECFLMEVRKQQRNEVEPMELNEENNANLLNGIAPLGEQQRKSNDESFGSTNEKEDAYPTALKKSVYEVAPEGGGRIFVMKPLVVSVGKMPPVEAEKNRTFAMDKNGTFMAVANGTFVVPSPTSAANGTFNVKSSESNQVNAIFDVRQLPGLANVVVMNNRKGTPEVAINASIITEDNSSTEETPEKVSVVLLAKKPAVDKKLQITQPKTKINKELVSLQSPIAGLKRSKRPPWVHRRTHAAKRPPASTRATRLPLKTATVPDVGQGFPAHPDRSKHPHGNGVQRYSASKLAHLQKKPTITSPAPNKSIPRTQHGTPTGNLLSGFL